MSKSKSSLAAKIARLGAGLATRQELKVSDIVIEPHPRHLKPRVKYMGVYFNATDLAHLNEIELWARQNGIRAGRGTLLKAGIRLIRKDESGLHALRQVMEEDGRRSA